MRLNHSRKVRAASSLVRKASILQSKTTLSPSRSLEVLPDTPQNKPASRDIPWGPRRPDQSSTSSSGKKRDPVRSPSGLAGPRDTVPLLVPPCLCLLPGTELGTDAGSEALPRALLMEVLMRSQN